MTEKQFKAWLKNRMNGTAYVCGASKVQYSPKQLADRVMRTAKEAQERAKKIRRVDGGLKLKT